MYFGTKSYLKSNHYHIPKHPLSHDLPNPHTQSLDCNIFLEKIICLLQFDGAS